MCISNNPWCPVWKNFFSQVIIVLWFHRRNLQVTKVISSIFDLRKWESPKRYELHAVQIYTPLPRREKITTHLISRASSPWPYGAPWNHWCILSLSHSDEICCKMYPLCSCSGQTQLPTSVWKSFRRTLPTLYATFSCCSPSRGCPSYAQSFENEPQNPATTFQFAEETLWSDFRYS